VSARLLLLPALLCALLSSCVAPHSVRRALTAPYRPSNIYLRQATLPKSIRRVAVLPLPRAAINHGSEVEGQWMSTIWVTELGKRGLFEVVPVTPDVLQAYTGRSAWAAEDELPLDFFKRISQATGCDAVMFASLTAFDPYPPMRIGWRARLVDCMEHQTWWSVDEQFDAGSDAVASAAEAYARAELNLPNPLLADTGVLHSPRRFSQYATCAVAATLPRR
jgi:hypothetical protein